MYNEKDQFLIEAKIKDIVYSDPSTFFRVLRVNIMDSEAIGDAKSSLKNEEVVHVVTPLIDKGDVFTARVVVSRSERYGHFLNAPTGIQMVAPQNEKELEDFMVRKVKGVGRKTAQKLIKAYGMDVLTVVATDDEALTRIGITKGKSLSLKDEFGKHQSFDQLAAFLYTMHLPTTVSIAIYEKLGVNSLVQVQQNPYLVTSFDYVTFTHADIIAHSLKKEPTSIERVKAGIVAFIESRVEDGDLCVLETDVFKQLISFLNEKGNYQSYVNDNITPNIIRLAIKELTFSQVVRKDTNNKGDAYLYLKKYHMIENAIVSSLEVLLTDLRPAIALKHEVENELVRMEQGSYLTEEEKQLGVTVPQLAKGQRKAISMAIESPISILTGGPGTGKTHTLNMLVKTMKNINPSLNIALLAPTGRASKRMSEMTNMPAMTIHRKLNLSGRGGDDGITTIEEDYVIIDEFSMVDAELFSALISNISDHTRILLVGDVDQLPSIGAGLILKDFIKSNRLPITELTEVFRQAQGSQIVMNAHKLMKGKKTVDKDGLSVDHDIGDMYFIKSIDTSHLKHMILRSIERQMEGYNRRIEDICVLSPMRIGQIGTIELNDDIQRMVNPPAKKKMELTVNKDRKITFRENDRVIHLVNNVDKNVMNGEIGTITSIYQDVVEKENGSKRTEWVVEVEYPDSFEGDKFVSYSETELEELELAYAISIHKSQGSEFPVVITPVHASQSRMMTRNLIYTAWTRAKDVLVVIGDEQELDKAVDRVDGTNRVSLLVEKLQNKLPAVA